MNPPSNWTPADRQAFLARHGLKTGWILCKVSEMFDMRKVMDECQRENDRLNKELARSTANRVALIGSFLNATESAVEFLRAVLTREQDPTVRMDLLAVIEKFEKLNTAMRPAAPNPPAPQAPV